ASDGTISITNSQGGYGTYEFSINNGSSWQESGDYTGLNNRNYQVVIRDKANPNCRVTLNPNLTITQPSILSATVSSTNVTCSGASDGTISITNPQGGYGTYEFSINNGSSWQESGSFTGLNNGTYQLVMRDKANAACKITINSNLVITQHPVLNASVSTINVTCFGGNNGSISITSPSGGYGTYQFSINNGTSWQDLGSFSGLKATTYNVMIRDRANPACSILLRGELPITQPADLVMTSSSMVPVTCFGFSDGQFAAGIVSGGNGNYQYSIDGTNFSTSSTFTNLKAGNYTLTVRDSQNCRITQQITITQPVEISVQPAVATEISCFNQNSGSITAGIVSGGNGDFQFSINGIDYFSSPTFTGLSAGSYSIFIKDSKGCSISQDVIVSQVEKMSASIAKTNISCFSGNDGSITISNPNGGSGIFEYSINNSWQSNGNFSGLTSGNY